MRGCFTPLLASRGSCRSYFATAPPRATAARGHAPYSPASSRRRAEDGQLGRRLNCASPVLAAAEGAGMTGGATSGAATVNVIAGTGIDVTADAVAVDVE